MTPPRPLSVDELAHYLAGFHGSAPPGQLGDRIQRVVFEQEAKRLVNHLEALVSGELRWLTLDEALDVLDVVHRTAAVRDVSYTVRCDRLWEIDDLIATRTVELLSAWAESASRPTAGLLMMLFASELDIARVPDALRLAMTAHRAGWRVLTAEVAAATPLVHVRVRGSSGEVVSLEAFEGTAELHGVRAIVRFEAAEPARDARASSELPTAVGSREFAMLPQTSPAARHTTNLDDGLSLSVADLFGESIMLRDFEPRSARLDGIGSFRQDLGWDAIYVPRKNEPEYARALLRIMAGADGTAPHQVMYVGDTLLNDGGAIRGLQTFGPADSVWGFLCGATSVRHEHDFTLGRIYFGSEWASLAAFLDYAQADGLALRASTWMLFDLDQTVYAAKGRDDEPLVRARWDAARTYLERIIPAYKFDVARAEALYREFDRDDYHPVTRDNLDYVVLLVLAVASGLVDATEIREYASASRPSIGALAEELRRRASMRVGHEDIATVLDAVKAVYYNTLAGDQTPCKDFRRLECLAMATRMRGDVKDEGAARIYLNREVVDVIQFIQGTGVQLFAVSDRPLEAAVTFAEDDDPADPTDLMTIPMLTRGVSLVSALRQSQ